MLGLKIKKPSHTSTIYLKNYTFQHGLHVSALMDRNKAGNVRNIEDLMFNHCCSGTYYECSFVALNIQHEMRMRYIAICGQPRSALFCHIFS
jgi:hypothetical protein